MQHEDENVERWMTRFRSGEKGRTEAATAFVAMGSKAVPSLVYLLAPTEAAITRAVAASTLWLLREKAAASVESLEKVLRTDADVMVRIRAAQALTGIVGTEHRTAMSALQQIATSSDPTIPAWIKAEASAVLQDAGGTV